VLLEGRVGDALPKRRQQLPDVRARHERGRGAGLAGQRRRIARARGAAPALYRCVRGGHEEVRRPRVALRRAEPLPPALIESNHFCCYCSSYAGSPRLALISACSYFNAWARPARQQQRVHARGQQLADDGVLARQPARVRRGRAGRQRQRRPAERGHVAAELAQRLADALLVQQERHHLARVRAG